MSACKDVLIGVCNVLNDRKEGNNNHIGFECSCVREYRQNYSNVIKLPRKCAGHNLHFPVYK